MLIAAQVELSQLPCEKADDIVPFSPLKDSSSCVTDEEESQPMPSQLQ